MTRTDNSTKAIACRVPMSDYIKFLTEASNKNMTLSEWLLVKVYSAQVKQGKQKASNSELEAKQKEINKLKSQVQELTKERDEVRAYIGEEIERSANRSKNISEIMEELRKLTYPNTNKEANTPENKELRGKIRDIVNRMVEL